MNILHSRRYNISRNGRHYCIGHLYINGTYFCDTIEDYDRGLDQSMSEQEARSIKIPSQTAIPTGTYTVKMTITSPTFSQKPYYKKVCNGRVPRLDPVVGFQGILIHCGRNEQSSAGCIIVGRNTKVGEVTNSQHTFEEFYRILLNAHAQGEKITYTIQRSYK